MGRGSAVRLLIIGLWPLGAFAQKPLDLEQARKYAVDHNYDIKALRLEIAAARARRARTDALFQPRLGVTAGAELAANLDESDAAPIGYLYGTYNLFNGYRDQRKARIADLETEKAEVQLAAEEHLVAVEVDEQFHNFLFRKSLIDLRERALTRNATHQQLVRKSRQLGTITDTDVMEFDLIEANVKSEMVALRQELEDARSNLKRLLGDEMGDQVQPVGELQHQHMVGDLMSYLRLVQEGGKDVRLAGREVQIAREARQESEDRWLPQVDVETRFGYLRRDEMLAEHKPQAQIVLTATMELYSGGDADSERIEREATAARREAELRGSINETIRAVEVAYRNLRVLEARADLERGILDNAKRYYEAVVAEYRRGTKNSSDVRTASDQWSEAEIRRVTRDYELIKARLNLEKLLGVRVAHEATHPEKGL